MKTALLAASLILIGGAAVGCGGDGGDSGDSGDGGKSGGNGAPTDASAAEFCEPFTALFEAASSGTDDDAMAASIREWVAAMEDVGTPADIPDDARAGFEIVFDQVKEVGSGDIEGDELQKLDADLSEEEKEQSVAFTAYLNDTCGNPLEEPEPSDPAS